MNKYKYIVIILLVGISIPFFLLQGNAQIPIKQYKNGEISLDIPQTWQEIKAQNSQIAAFKDPDTGNILTVNRQVLPTEKTLEEGPSGKTYKPNINFVINAPQGMMNDFNSASTQTGSASGTSFSLNTYNTNINGSPIAVKEMWLQKNNAIYSVIYKAKPENSSNIPFLGSESSKEFDIIKKSLKIGDANLKPAYVFGSLYMPRLGTKWNIRSDTINSNGVYHYSDSFYPGQAGSMGLIGHHTLFSAPFNHIENFKNGDKVYVSDYLTQKKYTYKVVNTKDIRYNYQTNKITFPANSNELILATCWPPGSKAAEIYIHCQLESIEPL